MDKQIGLWLVLFSQKCTAAAAAAELLQSCPTLCDPIDGSPPGSPCLGFSRQEHWSGLPFFLCKDPERLFHQQAVPLGWLSLKTDPLVFF